MKKMRPNTISNTPNPDQEEMRAVLAASRGMTPSLLDLADVDFNEEIMEFAGPSEIDDSNLSLLVLDDLLKVNENPKNGITPKMDNNSQGIVFDSMVPKNGINRVNQSPKTPENQKNLEKLNLNIALAQKHAKESQKKTSKTKKLSR
jgi:hypothetical protein